MTTDDLNLTDPGEVAPAAFPENPNVDAMPAPEPDAIVEDDPLPPDLDAQAAERNDVDSPADLEVDDATLEWSQGDEDLGEETGDAQA